MVAATEEAVAEDAAAEAVGEVAAEDQEQQLPKTELSSRSLRRACGSFQRCIPERLPHCCMKLQSSPEKPSDLHQRGWMGDE